jgi:hypothetical protein
VSDDDLGSRCPACDGDGNQCSLRRWHAGDHVHIVDCTGRQVRFERRPGGDT